MFFFYIYLYSAMLYAIIDIEKTTIRRKKYAIKKHKDEA